MGVKLAQLDALREIARLGSFTRAAEALGVTQPAVSQNISALQSELGLQLVEIRKSRPYLTEAGKFVTERARSIAESVESLTQEARGYAEGMRGALDIAATLTVGTHVLPQLLARFMAERPAIAPRVEIINTVSVLQSLRTGRASIGLVEGRVEDGAFVVEAFARDRLVLVVPASGHRFSRATVVDAAKLDGERFISRELGSGTRDFGYDALLAEGIHPRLTLELPSGEAIMRAVEAGIGLAIVSELVAAQSIAMKTVRACSVRGLRLERSFFIVRVRDRQLSPVAQAFSALVREGT